MGLGLMILGLALFVGVHGVTTQRDLRARLIGIRRRGRLQAHLQRSRDRRHRLIAYGFGQYRADGMIHIWHPPVWTKHLASLLMLPATILFVAAYLRGRIYAVVKHPMLTGVKSLGACASDRQRRSRLDHPVRQLAGLGGVRPHLAEAPQRCRRTADPGRRTEERSDRHRGRHRRLSGAGLRLPSGGDRRSGVWS